MNEFNFYILHLWTLEDFALADFLDNHTSLFCLTSFYFLQTGSSQWMPFNKWKFLQKRPLAGFYFL